MRQSFGAVSVDDICAGVGIKKASFYHHFPSKLDLTLAAYDHMWTRAQQILDPCFDRALPPAERLERFCQSFYAWQKEMFDADGKIYGCPIANAGHEMSTQDENIRAKVNMFLEGQCAYLRSLVSDWYDVPPAADDAAQLAREMFSYVMGVLYQAKVANDPEVIRRDLLSGLKRFLSIPLNAAA